MGPLPGNIVFEKYQADRAFAKSVDALFDTAEPDIDRFAKRRRIPLDPWYHDLPIWIMKWEEGGMTRTIQIVAGLNTPSDEPLLSIVSIVYRDEREFRKTQNTGTVAGGLRYQELKDGEKTIQLLEAAFKNAERVSELELTATRTFS